MRMMSFRWSTSQQRE